MIVSSAKFTASLFGVGGLWFAQTATADATTINWVERYGITGGIIVALIAVVKLQYSDSLKARAEATASALAARFEALAAKDALITAAEKNAALHLATATELIVATNHQTAELSKFTEKLLSMDAKVSACATNQFPFTRNKPEPTT